MAFKYSNNASSTLTAPITAAATSISISSADAGEFPSPTAGDKFALTLVDGTGALEVVWCTARTGGVLTVVRAQEGTTAKPFEANTRIDLRLTAGGLANFVQLTPQGTVPLSQSGITTAPINPAPTENDWLVGLKADGTALFRTTIDALKTVLSDIFLPKAGGTLTGTLNVKQAGNGGVSLLPGSPAQTGYLGFFNAANTRIGYIGYVSANSVLNYIAEGGTTGHRFSGDVAVTGSIDISGALTARSSLEVLSDANSHLWLRNLAGTEKALIYVGAVGTNLNVRLAGGTRNWAFQSDGSFSVGGATINLEGNLTGSVWTLFGTGNSDAFNAINGRIEQRGSAYYSSAVAQIMPTIAAQGHGAVGTYGMFKQTSQQSLQGEIRAGSLLQWCSADGMSLTSTSSPAGNWMAVSRILDGSSKVGIFKRVN